MKTTKPDISTCTIAELAAWLDIHEFTLVVKPSDNSKSPINQRQTWDTRIYNYAGSLIAEETRRSNWLSAVAEAVEQAQLFLEEMEPSSDAARHTVSKVVRSSRHAT